ATGTFTLQNACRHTHESSRRFTCNSSFIHRVSPRPNSSGLRVAAGILVDSRLFGTWLVDRALEGAAHRDSKVFLDLRAYLKSCLRNRVVPNVARSLFSVGANGPYVAALRSGKLIVWHRHPVIVVIAALSECFVALTVAGENGSELLAGTRIPINVGFPAFPFDSIRG